MRQDQFYGKFLSCLHSTMNASKRFPSDLNLCTTLQQQVKRDSNICGFYQLVAFLLRGRPYCSSSVSLHQRMTLRLMINWLYPSPVSLSYLFLALSAGEEVETQQQGFQSLYLLIYYLFFFLRRRILETDILIVESSCCSCMYQLVSFAYRLGPANSSDMSGFASCGDTVTLDKL